MFYEFDQNNSGGYFLETDTLCHRLFIEAGSEDEAIAKAEELGCYWDGVAKGIDCSCCGDRWCHTYIEDVPVLYYATEGYEVSVYCEDSEAEASDRWRKKYGGYKVLVPPKYKESKYGYRRYAGTVRFKDIEEYAQYLADEFGHWTKPDSRIYYEDGTVKEIFSTEKEAL